VSSAPFSLFVCLLAATATRANAEPIGQERATSNRPPEGGEISPSLSVLFNHGKLLFSANWTDQDGRGRPLTKGTGRPLSDPSLPLRGARAFNRISAPDANSCAGCHNTPFGITGGAGDIVTNVFVLGQRFDFATNDPSDKVPTRGSADEAGETAALEALANQCATTGMFGAGYLDMLARQITHDLQTMRDSIKPGQTKPLVAKGISFGKLTLTSTGTWDTSQVQRLPRLSLIAAISNMPPSLMIRPWHQGSNVVSIREFTNNAFNHHHGRQSTERFGIDTDPDGDGFRSELTRADVTSSHLKNCSRGKFPHTSFRASAMSSSETAIARSFQAPYALRRGRLRLAARTLRSPAPPAACPKGVSSLWPREHPR